MLAVCIILARLLARLQAGVARLALTRRLPLFCRIKLTLLLISPILTRRRTARKRHAIRRDRDGYTLAIAWKLGARCRLQ